MDNDVSPAKAKNGRDCMPKAKQRRSNFKHRDCVHYRDPKAPSLFCPVAFKLVDGSVSAFGVAVYGDGDAERYVTGCLEGKLRSRATEQAASVRRKRTTGTPAKPAPEKEGVPMPDEARVRCDECGKVFRSEQNCKIHQGRVGHSGMTLVNGVEEEGPAPIDTPVIAEPRVGVEMIADGVERTVQLDSDLRKPMPLRAIPLLNQVLTIDLTLALELMRDEVLLVMVDLEDVDVDEETHNSLSRRLALIDELARCAKEVCR